MTVDISTLIHDGLLYQGAIDMAPILAEEYGADLDLTIHMGPNVDRPFYNVQWTIVSARGSRLEVSRKALETGRLGYVAGRLSRLLPLISAYHQANAPILGTVNVCIEDLSHDGGLSLCSNEFGALLIPDTDFLGTAGYADFRSKLDRTLPSWESRRPKAFWRGSTTGLVWAVKSWRELPRIRLCSIAASRPDLFDVGVSSISQIEEHAAAIEKAGFMKPGIPALKWCRFRYQIDVDGNSNAWAGFFQRLLTGSPVLKVASPSGFRQWFYHRLQPWTHYVPVEADMVDLVEKVVWLKKHDRVAQLIGEQGRLLASSMTYDAEIPQAVLVVAAAIRETNAIRHAPIATQQ